MTDMEITRPLLKLLLEVGVASRRKVSDAIRQGRVQVNGSIVENFSYLLDSSSDVVTVDGKRINLVSEPKVYLMLNKPVGVLSTVKDSKNRKTVINMLPYKYRSLRIYPVGRLDKNSTGLILLSNDGQLTYQLTHPKFEHEKEYLIKIKQHLQPDAIRKIQKGIELDDGITYPAKIEKLNPTCYFNYSIVIHEGRKRQVRRMLDKLGYNVIALKRVRIGTLELGELEEGKIRKLSTNEVNMLLSNLC